MRPTRLDEFPLSPTPDGLCGSSRGWHEWLAPKQRQRGHTPPEECFLPIPSGRPVLLELVPFGRTHDGRSLIRVIRIRQQLNRRLPTPFAGRVGERSLLGTPEGVDIVLELFMSRHKVDIHQPLGLHVLSSKSEVRISLNNLKEIPSNLVVGLLVGLHQCPCLLGPFLSMLSPQLGILYPPLEIGKL
jgi:hypothetical protein